MARTIAVIGASNDRRKFGNKAVRAYLRHGYTVIPINPREETIEGLKAYRSVLDVPGRIDSATMYVPPDVGRAIIDELAQKGIGEVWLNPGADGDALVTRARELHLDAIVGCSILGVGENPYLL
ncbi:MAG TPA: CoA-binding protein [Vicinamibacterales bacterium]|nr:CoA-binding protein [Vicinamibacterales bacterium]